MISKSNPKKGSPPERIPRQNLSSAVVALTLAAPTLAADRVWDSSWGDWSEAGKWTPHLVPGPADHAFVGTTPASFNTQLSLDSPVWVNALTLSGTASLYADGFALTVSGTTHIDGTGPTGSDARLYIENGAAAVDFQTGSLQISSLGSLLLQTNSMAVVNGPLTIGADGELVGYGRVTAHGNLSNSGKISAFGGNLRIDLVDGDTIDLDGTTVESEIIINDPGTDLIITAGAVADAVEGTMCIGGDSILNMSVGGSWAIGPQGALVSSWWGSDNYIAALQGAPVSFGGSLIIDGAHNTLRVQSESTFLDTAHFYTRDGGLYADDSNVLELNNDSSVQGGLFELTEGSRIEFNDVTTIEGGTFLLQQGARVEFNGPTTVEGGEFATFSQYAADGAILFNGATTWRGTIYALGIARQMGNATVSATTAINATVFDMDGGGANWNINTTLTINAEAIDELTLPNAFNTQMTIGPSLFSRLVVNLNDPVYWQMGGQMTIIGDPTLFPTRLAGNTVYITGGLTLASGRAHVASDLIFSHESTTTIPAGATLQIGGKTQIYAGSEFAGDGTLRNAASGALSFYPGASLGNVGLVNAGRMMVSLFPGIASVGRFENTADGIFTVNVTGPELGDEYDQLVVSNGQAVLDGTLRVNHYDIGAGAFDAAVGDEFTILTAVGGVSGTFDANPVSYRWGERFDWAVVYGANDVKLRLAEISRCGGGDVDDDGDTDLQDLAILLAHFGEVSGADWNDGDLDGDGDVELQDLAILLAAFGSSCL